MQEVQAAQQAAWEAEQRQLLQRCQQLEAQLAARGHQVGPDGVLTDVDIVPVCCWTLTRD